MKKSTISAFSRLALLLVMVLFFASLFYPIWRIELWAPQYPEGLALQLHANKIGGDVEIINGLNHYIGMKTLHTENFPEFSFLSYIIGLFGVAALIVGVTSRRKALYWLFGAYVLFGILAALDFYRWNYQYGHDLDPNAAIRVPGMAYQPPLIGYKQLLNFGAYSIPDVGGWMLIGAFVLLAAAVFIEARLHRRLRNSAAPTAMVVLLLALASCGKRGPVPIMPSVDQCAFCKMTISDVKYGAEAITDKGRIYKFDDIACMRNYSNENTQIQIAAYYVSDFGDSSRLIAAKEASFISGGSIVTPMHGDIIAFSSAEEASATAKAMGATPITWQKIIAGK